MDITLAGAVTVLAGLPILFFLGRRRDARERRRAIDHLSKNPALTAEVFAQTYFPADKAEIARVLRKLLAPHLPFDLARLHPDDRLIEDLRMDALDSMSTVEFILSVEKEFSVKITEADSTRLRTLRDLVDLVAHHRP